LSLVTVRVFVTSDCACPAVAEAGPATTGAQVIEAMSPSAKAGELMIRAPAAEMVTRPAAALSFFRTSSPCYRNWHETH
jgi:hypothetical protein